MLSKSWSALEIKQKHKWYSKILIFFYFYFFY